MEDSCGRLVFKTLIEDSYRRLITCEAYKELFIQINWHVKFIDRGFQDWQGPEMINDYECRG